MYIGLTKKELDNLSSFGETPEERVANVWGNADNLGALFDNMGGALQRKMVELIAKNNERIAEQLTKAGIKLPD